MISIAVSLDELDAIVSALHGLDEEYGLVLGELPQPPLHPHTKFDRCGEGCPTAAAEKAHQDAVTAAYARGAALIERLESVLREAR